MCFSFVPNGVLARLVGVFGGYVRANLGALMFN